MFLSKAKDRQRRSTKRPLARLGQKLSRHLGVEAMEDRMMLAATGLEFETSAMPVAQIGLLDNGVNTVGGTLQPSSDNLLVQRPEGGFVANYFWGADSTSSQTLNVAGNPLDYVPPIVNRGNVGNVGTSQDVTTGDWPNSDGLEVYEGGLEPANIFETPKYVDAVTTPETNIVSDRDGPSNLSEGGPISIPVILASRELMGGSQFDRAIETKSLAADLSVNSVPPSLLATNTLALNAISAEWARGRVLETAGGEPEGVAQSDAEADSELSSAVDSVPRQKAGEPLSTHQPHGSTEKTAVSATDNEQAGQAAANSRAVQLRATDGLVRVVGVKLAEFSPAESVGNAAIGGAGQGTTVAASNNSAVDTAFDEFGGSDQSLLQMLADESWRRPLSATPLLMVLALERIATGNSRRANRAAALVGRPKLERLVDDSERP